MKKFSSMIGRNLDDENFKKIQKFVKKNRINQRKIEENSQKKNRKTWENQRKSYHSEKKLSFRENSERIQRKIQPNHIIPTKPHNSLQEKLHGHF